MTFHMCQKDAFGINNTMLPPNNSHHHRSIYKIYYVNSKL